MGEILNMLQPVGTFLYNLLTVVAHATAIGAYGIAIYLFIWKRKAISSLFDLLVNYSYQLTLSELKEKLERLNEYNAKNEEGYEQIVIILNEMLGQIRGNDRLKIPLREVVSSIEELLTERKKLSEPRKRALVAEVRERLRHLNIQNMDELVGDQHER